MLNRRSDATERLLDFAQNLESSGKKEERKDEWRNLPLEKRIEHSLVKGFPEFVDEDMAEAVKIYQPALNVIEGPLMDGMNIVGEFVWCRENVFAAGNQIGTGNEKSGSLFTSLY